MEELRQKKIIDEWVRMWLDKDLPKEITTYEEWRIFRDYWYSRSKLDYNECLSLYRLSKSKVV